MKRALKIGILIDSQPAPRWMTQLAQGLAALDGVEATLLLAAERSQPARWRALQAYLALERKIFRNIPTVETPAPIHLPLTQDADSLDVIIAPSAAQPFHPRYGVWTWGGLSPAAGFYETLRGETLMEISVRAALPNGEEKLLRRAVFPADPFSAARSRSRAYLKAGAAMLWAAKALLLRGESFLTQAPAAPNPFPTPKPPSPWNLAALAARQVQRGWMKKFGRGETWTLLAAQNELNPPPGAYWADPMTYARDGRVFLFAEEFERGRGKIVCLSLNENAEVVSRQTALERPYHLSYPFLFEHAGALYMLPETAANKTIEAYRCVEFPGRWEFAGALMKNIYAVDSTLLHHNGRWWLFANLMNEAGASSWDELHIFYADHPLSADWTPHALNPVLSDARFARPAGAFFFRNGELIRPSQDCSRGYGYAINLNRVEVLNEREYAETPIEKILPPSGFVATHTYSQAGKWIFTDGRRKK
ncbi:MAG: hypothetical protein Fur002_13870 [Anaerolineales bacterium]